MENQLFKNQSFENEFNELGIIKVPFCSIETIQDLTKIFHSFHPISDELMRGGYYFSIFGKGPKYMLDIKNQLYPILKPLLNNHFKDYKILSIILQIKGTGDDSSVGIHQDLTSVDENIYKAATVWIPLSPSTKENGSLFFLTGSQKCFRGYRAHTADNYLFKEVHDYILNNSVNYTTELGEALIFDPGTIHFSPPNKSENPRLSIAISVVSQQAQVQIGYVDKINSFNKMEIYSVPDNFYYLYEDFKNERMERPIFGTFIKLLEQPVNIPYDYKSFVSKYRKSTLSKNTVFDRIRNFLSLK